MNLRAFEKRLQRVQAVLQPVPKDTLALYLVFNEDGSDYPGYEQHNQEHKTRAKTRRIPPDVYVGFDPDQDGIEP